MCRRCSSLGYDRLILRLEKRLDEEETERYPREEVDNVCVDERGIT